MYDPLLHPASTPTYMPQRSNLTFQLDQQRHMNEPDDAITSTHQLREGDVVIFATDGVWNNISGEEILPDVFAKMLETRCWKVKKGGAITVSSEHLAAAMRGASGALHTTLAKTVVSRAKSVGIEARRNGLATYPQWGPTHFDWRVGDTTVVVTVVTKESPNPSVPKDF